MGDEMFTAIIWILLIGIVISAILGFILGVVVAAVYNLAVKIWGHGVELEIVQNVEERK